MRVLLAYSGGLDTSFLVAWLTRELGHSVTTLAIDCGGWSGATRRELARRALATGAVEHLTEDARAELYERVIAGQTRSLGPSAPDTLIARYGYWNAAWKAGDFDGAAAGFEELVGDVVAALGENDRLAAQSESALARALADGGRKDEALPHAERAAERLAEIYGSDHPRTRSAQQLADEHVGSLVLQLLVDIPAPDRRLRDLVDQQVHRLLLCD